MSLTVLVLYKDPRPWDESFTTFPEDLSGVLKACLLPSSSLLKTLKVSLEGIFSNSSRRLLLVLKIMSFTVLVLAEDPEYVLSTSR
jgi:hypothetical protein